MLNDKQRNVWAKCIDILIVSVFLWQRTSNHDISHRRSPTTDMNKRDAFSSSNFFWNLLSLAKVSQEIVRLHTAVVTQSVVKVCLLCMEEKKTWYTSVSQTDTPGAGACWWGLESASAVWLDFRPLHSLPSEVKELCLFVGRSLYCLVMNALSKKSFSRLQSWMCPPLWFVLRWQP